MEVPALSKTRKPTLDLNIDPKTTVIALVEIEPLLPASWSSFPSLNNSHHQETKQQTTKKFDNLLKEMNDLLKNTKCYEKITKTRESSEETNISEDESELKEQIRGLDKINKVLLTNLGCLDLDKDQNSKKQEITSENQNSKDTVQDLARDLVNHSEEKRAVNETQLSKEKAESRFHHVQEESIKLRNNMEQLLQEAELWSVQHAELSELIKVYQKSQNDIRVTLKSKGIHFQTQQNNKVPANYELEAQVRKLNHDMHSLHLIAALLENECQFLQQRVELLKELRYQKDATLQEKPIQMNHEQDKKEQKLLEAEKVERYKQKLQDMEGTFQNKDTFYKSQDSCRNKKARNNRFNIRLTRALWRKKRPTSSLR
ncbi:spermatogenic leucine zipper protein 1 [Molossus molossus]|uniref:Spermatogenic leucine zipper 1 n=1 Tax=Molossus molossus TaxID=27622 RepID=A0A7J8J3H5_MOLMO|nr:spermatogenic leucine zipper protein 1 [Molossus molossus]KAF6491081.1 spermatogenic leucine zipper 1 [Molossus molossus]